MADPFNNRIQRYTLSLGGCPANATCSVGPTPLTPSGAVYPAATLRVTPTTTTLRRTYAVKLTGTTTSPTVRRLATARSPSPETTLISAPRSRTAVARPAGFEPATSASGGQRSIH